LADTVCLSCHSDAGLAFGKKHHSRASMETTHNPLLREDWSTNCIDCHSHHRQDQLNWVYTNGSYEPGLYLVTGSVTNITPSDGGTPNDFTDDSTVVDISISLPANDVNSNWVDPAKWLDKSEAVPGRGLVFVEDTGKIFNSYMLTAATINENGGIIDNQTPGTYTGQITVSGYFTESTGSDGSFGLIYGMLIRDTMTFPLPHVPSSPTRDVQFFDPYTTYDDNLVGGFVDPVNSPANNGTLPKGICQACHGRTTIENDDQEIKYWKNDGSGNTHHTGSLCTDCHETVNGFKPAGAHTQVELGAATFNSEPCYVCHNTSNGNLAVWSDILIEHNVQCTTCHSSVRTTNLDPASGYTSIADVIANAKADSYMTSCLTCHYTHVQIPSHATFVEGDGTTCATNCHLGTTTSGGIPQLNPINNKVHFPKNY